MPLPKIKPIIWRREDDKAKGHKPEPLMRQKHIFHQPEPFTTPATINNLDVIRLLKFFESFHPQLGTLKLNCCTMILNQQGFIERSISTILNNTPESRVFQAEVERLKEYYKILSN